MANCPVDSFRRASFRDSFLLRKWRNSGVVQEMDQTFTRVSLLRHLRWAFTYERRLLSFIVSDDKGDIGYVRFQSTNREGEYSWSFAKVPFRKGVGLVLMAQGIKICVTVLKGRRLVAKVHKSNFVSMSLHSRLGFQENSLDFDDSIGLLSLYLDLDKQTMPNLANLLE